MGFSRSCDTLTLPVFATGEEIEGKGMDATESGDGVGDGETVGEMSTVLEGTWLPFS